jgi:hypothetical protein
MNKTLRYAVGVSVLIGIGAAVYFLKPAPIVAPPTPVARAPVATTPEPPRYPVPSADQDLAGLAKMPLPALDESDPSLREVLSNLVGKESFESLWDSEEILRKFVVTITNAQEGILPREYFPLNPLPGNFLFKNEDGHLVLDPKNYDRYSAILKVVDALDIKKCVGIYFHFYPLMQTTYQEISNHGYFNDRVIKAIDLMLATPEVSKPISLTLLDKSYRYVDTHLEQLTGMQKLFLRSGPENMKKVKEKLRAFRTAIILGIKK